MVKQQDMESPGTGGFWGWLNGKTEGYEQRMFDRANGEFTKPFGEWAKETVIDLWDWFVGVLPEIAGYGVLATGAFVMISPLVTRGGIGKPLGILAAGLAVTVCILTTQ